MSTVRFTFLLFILSGKISKAHFDFNFNKNSLLLQIKIITDKVILFEVTNGKGSSETPSDNFLIEIKDQHMEKRTTLKKSYNLVRQKFLQVFFTFAFHFSSETAPMPKIHFYY